MLKSRLKRFLIQYFDQTLGLKIQFFNLLALVGAAAGVAIAIIGLAVNEQRAVIVIDFFVSVFLLGALFAVRKKGCYNLCSWLIIVVVFMMAFPALFLFYGGYSNGITCFFIFAFVMTAHILEKRQRLAAVVLEFAVYISCFLIYYHNYAAAASMASEPYHAFKTIVNFSITGLLLLITLILRSRMNDVRQKQIQELNRELEARNETLIRYDKMKGDFLGTVAHEINTPLAIIAASSQDTLDLLKVSPLNMDEIMENQVIIEKRVKLIDSILLDLMDAVAIENGRLSLKRQLVNLPAFMRSVCAAHFKQFEANNNRLTCDLKQDMTYVWADPARIEQVMANLLSNAARYTQNGVITVKLSKAEDKQIVSVNDNGEGMDAEFVKTVLKQYVSTKADYWRHGIGLHVCRQIITAHGGEIWIESEKGRGTSVFFSLMEASGDE